MPPQPRLTAKPVMRIFCKKSDELVGFLYLWNNGDLQIAWVDEPIANIRYELMAKAA